MPAVRPADRPASHTHNFGEIEPGGGARGGGGNLDCDGHEKRVLTSPTHAVPLGVLNHIIIGTAVKTKIPSAPMESRAQNIVRKQQTKH